MEKISQKWWFQLSKFIHHILKLQMGLQLFSTSIFAKDENTKTVGNVDFTIEDGFYKLIYFHRLSLLCNSKWRLFYMSPTEKIFLNISLDWFKVWADWILPIIQNIEKSLSHWGKCKLTTSNAFEWKKMNTGM